MKWIAVALVATIGIAGCLNELGIVSDDTVKPSHLITNERSEWLIEIDYVQGHRPSSQAISLLEDRLHSLVKKDTIRVIVDDVIPSQGADQEIRDFESLKRLHKDKENDGDTVVTYVLYVNGNSAQDTSQGSVLGLAYSHNTIVMFDETINNAANLRFSSTAIEEAVLVHEFGHILGLVNNGIDMVNPHEGRDSDGKPNRHSDNTASVMTPAVETTDILNLIGGLPTDFDSDDRADICAAGGKCGAASIGGLPFPL